MSVPGYPLRLQAYPFDIKAEADRACRQSFSPALRQYYPGHFTCKDSRRFAFLAGGSYLCEGSL